MRDYDSAGIRNIAVVGHGGSGKTSLVDALCFAAGGKRHGSVRDGTALTDHEPRRDRARLLHHLGCAYAEWMDSKINFIDTPGYARLPGRRDRRPRRRRWRAVRDQRVSGVEVGTERMFREAVARQIRCSSSSR
jgi:elongation factor G